jgi:hypothetical protein
MSTALPAQRLPSVRVREWPERLAALFAARAGTPFTWGQHDCCLFAADAVLAVTGHDLAADLRGTYSTAAEAARVLAQLGGVVGIAIARAGKVVPAALAQPGDVGLSHHDPERPSLAVWGGAAWHAAAAVGVVALQPDAVVRAWRCTATPEEVPRA